MKRLFLFGVCFLMCHCTGSSVSHQTNSQPSSVTPVRFIAVGDTGTGDVNQQAVADVILAQCQLEGCDFVLLLGDNFYDSGVTSVDDPLWQTAFEIPYADFSIPFYPVLGNHDMLGNAQAEIDYSSNSSKWVMSDRYYVVSEPVTNPLIDFFALDSNNFDSTQASWLEQALAQSTSTWKVIYDHHPLYSNGPHGDDHAGLSATLVPLICGKINFILSGHDHDKEHLIGTTDHCSFNQIVLGTGGRELYTPTPDERTLFAASTFGFGWFEVTEETVNFKFIDNMGVVEYESSITP